MTEHIAVARRPRGKGLRSTTARERKHQVGRLRLDEQRAARARRARYFRPDFS